MRPHRGARWRRAGAPRALPQRRAQRVVGTRTVASGVAAQPEGRTRARDPVPAPRRATCWSKVSGPASCSVSALATRRSPRARRASSTARSAIPAARPGAITPSPRTTRRFRVMAGLASVNLGRDGRPALAGVSAADMAGSLMALAGILMALVRQCVDGKGDFLDIADQRCADGVDPASAWRRVRRGPRSGAGRRAFLGRRCLQQIDDTNDGRAI